MNRAIMKNLLWLFALVLLLPAVPSMAIAGGGPENLFLVVNPASPTSLAIANHYVHLRQVPCRNVFYLRWDPDVQKTDVETFRRRILGPVLGAISERKLQGQIDYVVYSSDFPWGIDLQGDVKRYQNNLPNDKPNDKKRKWPRVLTRVGSLNGLTYLWQAVMAGKMDYIGLSANRYMRRPAGQGNETPTIGFSSRFHFAPGGDVVQSAGRRYLLSVVLGATAGKDRRGNTLAEVIGYLRRSAAVDGTRPHGTIYFADSGDIRSRVRAGLFPLAVSRLKKLDVAAEIVEAKMPKDKPDVQGVMLGLSGFNWKASHSKILPGAICDHLTSTGGVMRTGRKQTPLTELLRYGAAGASGTVTEPFAIPAKFPSPMIHVHYARGCTLAEAFYQSVHGPYQLLIVGDPLCRPWAKIPTVTVRGVESGATVQGRLTLKPFALAPGGEKIEHFELFVDGLRTGRCKPGEQLSLDTTELADGYHELRIVAVAAPPIRTQGRLLMPITSANHGRTIEVFHVPQKSVPVTGTLAISANSPKATQIHVLHNGRLLEKIQGESGLVEINPNVLGEGPVELSVVALCGDRPKDRIIAKPLKLVVEPKKTVL